MSAGTLGYYRGFGAMSRPRAPAFPAAAEYVRAMGLDAPGQLQQGQSGSEYSQGNPDNGFSFTGMYMNDAFHATNQVPLRAVREGLICL